MAKELRQARLPGLTGGVNYTEDVFSIAANQAYLVRNCHLLPGGVATTRNGSRILNAAAPLGGPVTSLYQFSYPDGSGMLSTVLVTAGSTLYRWDEDTETFVFLANLSGTDRPCWATFTNGSNISHAFMCNGVDFIKYNGRTVSRVSPLDSDYPWLRCAPRYLVEYDDRLMAAGCDSDPYKVFVSEALDGTNWLPGQGGTAQYWTAKGAKGDRVRGLATVYDYGVIVQERSVSIITEADPDSSTSQQILVNSEHGATSHWSVLSVGSMLYMADSNGIYRGVLRQAVENGLVFTDISDNVAQKYRAMRNYEDAVAVYDSQASEIWFCAANQTFNTKDTALVYSTRLSSGSGEERHVWSGWFDGSHFRPHSVAEVIMPDGARRIWSGDTAGYVSIHGEEHVHKDQYAAAGVAASADITSEIVLPPMAPGGLAIAKMARQFTPTLAQRYNASTQVQYIIDGTYTEPTVSQYSTASGRIPDWRASTTTTEFQTWNSIVWADNPYIPVPLALFEPFKYVQFRLLNAGSNARDSISYSGAELLYQVHGVRHTQG